MPQISVIIPAYNTERYIKKCINSVINQTFNDIEVICIDDGSTDETGKILDVYAQKDKRVKVIHQNNSGQAEAKKNGIKIASGKYIAFIDSDDWIKKNMYEEMYFYAQKFDTDAVCCGYFSIKENSCVEVLPDVKSGLYGEDKHIYRYLYDIDKSKVLLNWTYWTYLFKREKIYEYVMKVTNIEQAEDVVAVWSFLVNAESLYVLDKAYYYYRVRQGSSCRRENPNFLTNINKAYILLKEEFNKNSHADFLLRVLKYAMFDIVQSGSCFTSERQDFFMFPYEKIPLKSRIVLYGAGMVGKSYYRQIQKNYFCEIVLWVDKSHKSLSNSKYKIMNPEMINDVDFEYLLIAVLQFEAAKKIAENLVEVYHIDPKKIVVYEPKRISKFVDLDDYNGVD